MATVSSRPPGKWREVPAKLDPSRPMGMTSAARVDLEGLHHDLARAIAGEVRFGRDSLALYATDSSNFRQTPLGVVIPRTLEDVVATHRVCHAYGAPIVNRGGGTSLSGETVNFAVVIDHSKFLTRIGEPDPTRRMVTVEPGAINEQVNIRTGKVGLVFGPGPSSHAYCCIGGNIGNNSCGIHSVQSQLYGPGPRTSDNVHAMDIVTYAGDRFRVGVNEEPHLERIVRQGGPKGEIYRRLRELRDRWAPLIRQRYRPVSEVPRRVSGYNLDELLPERGFNVARALVGTESTCATALEATLLLTPALFERFTVVVGYEDLGAAGDHVPEILEWRPIGLEGIDEELYQDERQEGRHRGGLADLAQARGHAWLMAQFGSDSAAEVEETATRFVDWLVHKKGVARERVRFHGSRQVGGDTEALWQVREGGLGATAFPPAGKDHWPGWEDSAVPPTWVGAYIRDLKALYRKHGLAGAMYGHLGQGCIHTRISFDLRDAQGMTPPGADIINLVLSTRSIDGRPRSPKVRRRCRTDPACSGQLALPLRSTLAHPRHRARTTCRW